MPASPGSRHLLNIQEEAGAIGCLRRCYASLFHGSGHFLPPEQRFRTISSGALDRRAAHGAIRSGRPAGVIFTLATFETGSADAGALLHRLLRLLVKKTWCRSGEPDEYLISSPRLQQGHAPISAATGSKEIRMVGVEVCRSGNLTRNVAGCGC